MSFKEKLGKQFVITTELGPTNGVNVEETLEKARRYLPLDAVNIHDCPMANLRINSIALSHIVQTELGIETIPHFTCRDRSLLGTQADLLGAHALGIRFILPTTGDGPQHGPYPSKPVYDLDTLGLISLIRNMNRGVDYNEKEFGGCTDFTISATAAPSARNREIEFRRVQDKIQAGAHFFQTQPVYDAEKAIAFMQEMSPLQVPVILGIMPLKGLKMAEYMQKNVAGVDIPEQVMDRLRQDGKAGVRIACELIQQIYPYVNGIHIMALGNIDGTNEIIEFVQALKERK
ncbi:MAG: methylenetetrahydrofolate reductase [bacterium]